MNYKDRFEEGYAIFLTNDESYKKKAKVGCSYEAFSLHPEPVNMKHGKLKWGADTSVNTRKGCGDEIVLEGCYKIEWHDYPSGNDEKFYYTYAKIKQK